MTYTTISNTAPYYISLHLNLSCQKVDNLLSGCPFKVNTPAWRRRPHNNKNHSKQWLKNANNKKHTWWQSLTKCIIFRIWKQKHLIKKVCFKENKNAQVNQCCLLSTIQSYKSKHKWNNNKKLADFVIQNTKNDSLLTEAATIRGRHESRSAVWMSGQF